MRDAATGKAIRVLKGYKGPVPSISFSRDGRLLTSGSDDGTVRLCNISTDAPPRVLTGPGEESWFVAFSTDGRTPATAGYEDTVWIRDVATETERRSLTWARLGFGSGAFSPRRRTLATTSGSRVHLWNTALPDPRAAKTRSCQALRRDFAARELSQYAQKESELPVRPQHRGHLISSWSICAIGSREREGRSAQSTRTRSPLMTGPTGRREAGMRPSRR
ncbi:WD40 repeat domain-containing protein [Streptomyces atratus]|uniref:WD40 repeat domain-containing protein n=1 Tax=Streptomyces atratus TaxID=1893 RepID=UPI0033C4D416